MCDFRSTEIFSSQSHPSSNMSKTDLAVEYSLSIIEDIITDVVRRVENNNAEDFESITVPEENCECSAEGQEEAKEQEEQKEIRSK